MAFCADYVMTKVMGYIRFHTNIRKLKRPKEECEVSKLIHFYIQESAKKLLLTLEVANFLGSRH